MSAVLTASAPPVSAPPGPDQPEAFPAAALPDPAAQVQGIARSIGQIAQLVQGVQGRLVGTVREIEQINLQTQLLSFNAQLEATRAGASGNAFNEVAREMVDLSSRTAAAAQELDAKAQHDIAELGASVERIGWDMRGARLSDMALTNIDLIDRNLYERSCDVRWWATDASCVDAALDPAAARRADQRLGVILDSYTVYFDIVLCDLQGRVIANGRPEKYPCRGSHQADTRWFREAAATRSGSEFGFEGPHRSGSLAGGQPIAVYSALVRRGGRTAGEPIGCLGVIFNWEALAQTIVQRTQVAEEERADTRVCIVDRGGLVIADNRGRHLQSRLPLGEFAGLIRTGKGYACMPVDGQPHLVAYGLSPGFETYSTGWHSFILQRERAAAGIGAG